MMSDFSYRRYRQIIKELKDFGQIATFYEVIKKRLTKFIVIRHDIEFSIDHALGLAEIEKEMGIKTTYLVQIRNPIYNPFSKANLKSLKNILSLGHELGLHYYCDKEKRFNKSRSIREIKQGIKILSLMLDAKVTLFSIHRPNDQILSSYLKIPGLINCYDKKFFYYWPKENGQVDTDKLPIVYLSDSNNRWKFGEPLEIIKTIKPKKLHILCHPYSWNDTDLNDQTNLNILFKRKVTQLNKNFIHELKNYRSNSSK